MKVYFFFVAFLIFNISSIAQVSIENIKINSTACKDSLAGSISFDVKGAVPPINYQWDKGLKNTNVQNGLGVGTYSVTITDANNNSLIKKFEIEKPKRMKIFYHHECSRYGEGHIAVFDSILNAKLPIVYKRTIYQINHINGLRDSIIHSINIKNLTKFPSGLGTGVLIPPSDSAFIFKCIFTDSNGCVDSIENIKAPLKGGVYSPHYPFDFARIERINNYHVIDSVFLEKNNFKPGLIEAELRFFPENREELKAIQWYRNDEPFNCNQCEKIIINQCENAKYKLVVSSIYGCYHQDSVFIICKEPKDSIIPLNPNTLAYFPTAFSPNDDGINDNFTVFSDEKVEQIKEFIIFDRWGGEIFKTSNIPVSDESKGWNGKAPDNELMPQGNYTYFCRLRLKDGTEKSVKGEVMLMR